MGLKILKGLLLIVKELRCNKTVFPFQNNPMTFFREFYSLSSQLRQDSVRL
jgi:hypothetical protein